MQDATCLGRVAVGLESQGFAATVETKAPDGRCFRLTTPTRTYHMMADKEVRGWAVILMMAIAACGAWTTVGVVA